MKIVKLSLIFGLVFCLGGCFNKKENEEIKTKEELISYFEDVTCIINMDDEGNKSYISCDYKDKYEITDEEVIDGTDQVESRFLQIKLNDYDINFEVFSIYDCASLVSSSICKERHGSNYDIIINDYFTKKYNKSKKVNEEEILTVKNEKDVKKLASYLNGYLEYVDNLNSKDTIIPISYKIVSIIIADQTLSLNIYRNDQKYFYYIVGNDRIEKIENVEEYLMNYYKENLNA